MLQYLMFLCDSCLLKAHASTINLKAFFFFFCSFLFCLVCIWEHACPCIYAGAHTYTLTPAHKPLQLLWWKLHRHLKERQQPNEESVLTLTCGCVYTDDLFSPYPIREQIYNSDAYDMHLIKYALFFLLEVVFPWWFDLHLGSQWKWRWPYSTKKLSWYLTRNLWQVCQHIWLLVNNLWFMFYHT